MSGDLDRQDKRAGRCWIYGLLPGKKVGFMEVIGLEPTWGPLRAHSRRADERQIENRVDRQMRDGTQRATNASFNDEGTVNITLSEFKAAVVYATERLRSL